MNVCVAPPGSTNGIGGIGVPGTTGVALPDPDSAHADAVITVAVACPVFVTVSRTWTVWPAHIDAGTSVADATRAGGVWITTETDDAESRGTDPHVVPEPVPVKTGVPEPLADQVHTKVVAVLDASVAGPGGSGPETASTSGPPGPTYMVAVTPETADPPPFDTVKETVNHCPIETWPGAAFATVHRNPAGVSVIAFDSRRPVVMAWFVFDSIPVTVAARVTSPASDPVNVHV